LEATTGEWGLRVAFEFRGDRWSHQIAVSTPGQPSGTVLESVEGTSDDRWPPSPTFQELVFDQGQSLAQRNSTFVSRVAQLLGKAGNNFWSASFELFSNPLKLVVDVACRVAADRGFVGSTYGVTPTQTQHLQDGALRLIECDGGSVEWIVTNGVLHREASASEQWIISPSGGVAQSTLRWRYEFLVTTVSTPT
jgi:hypothetical protein